eukprot:3287793-Rhodomonas_salina.6
MPGTQIGYVCAVPKPCPGGARVMCCTEIAYAPTGSIACHFAAAGLVCYSPTRSLIACQYKLAPVLLPSAYAYPATHASFDAA